MTRKNIICLVLSVFCCLTLCGAAEERMEFVHIGLNEGLSQCSVLDIRQDDMGNIWMATFNGLNKYNGYEFSVYKRDEADSCSLDGDIIRLCHKDRQGRIWAASSKGLALYDMDADNFRNFYFHEKECLIKGLADYSDDVFLLFVNKKLCLFDKNTGVFFEDDFTSQLSAKAPTCVSQCGDRIYVGSGEGLFEYSCTSGKVTSWTDRIMHGRTIQCVLEEGGHGLWVGTEGTGLFYLDRKTGQWTTYVHDSDRKGGICSDYVRSLAFDADGRLWVGTLNGLNVFDGQTKEFVFYGSEEEGGLSHSSVRSLFRDSQGGMWVGTYYGGVNYFHPFKKRFDSLDFAGGTALSEKRVVGCIYEDASGNLWIGTNENGVYCYSPQTGRSQCWSIANGLSSNDVKAVYVDEAKRLAYVGTHAGGLNVIDLRSGRVQVVQAMNAHSNIYAIEPLSDGRLLVSNISAPLYFDPATMSFEKAGLRIVSILPGVMFIKRDRKGRIWIGGKNGVGLLEEKNGHVQAVDLFGELGFAGKYVNSVFEAADGKYYLATRSGLFSYDEGSRSVKQYTVKHGLPDDVVYGVMEDEQSRLWLSTDRGLSCFNPENEQFKNYQDIDGILGNQFVANAFCHAQNGRMYVGGINGITTFSPSRLMDNPYTPPVIITQLRLFNKIVRPGDDSGILKKDISFTRSIRLKAAQKMFSLQFVVPNYLAGKHNTFAYKLDGYDKEWYTTDMRTVSYSNLPHGTYHFLVKAANNDGQWNEQATSLEIVVLPVWYMTWWAICLFVLAFCTLVYLVIRYFGAKKMMTAQLEMERRDRQRQQEIAEMKQRFFINMAHELRTPLTLISAPLGELMAKVTDRGMRKQLKYIDSNTDKLLHIVNRLMDYRKVETGAFDLKLSRNNVYRIVHKTVKYYEPHAKERKISFSFDSDMENRELLCDPSYVELILNNILSNAFKYSPDGASVSVSLNVDGDRLVLVVKDSGYGISPEQQEKIFERFYQVDKAATGSGVGLFMVKELVQRHHGTIGLVSTLGEGSCFTVELPVDESAYSAEELAAAGECEDENKQAVLGHASAGKGRTLIEASVLDESLTDTGEDEPVASAERRYSVLIVEDNREILSFLSDNLGGDYNVYQAENGAVALKLLDDKEVDLILTDVMMPVMDGLQLCKKVKQNVRTCHIPVLILSAKAEVDEQLEGLQLGADDYIPKPFVMNVLKSKIRNLFRTRYRALQFYSQSLEVEPDKMSLSALDEEILTKAKRIVEEHISDVEFSTDAFAGEMCMSRSALHLKLKAITGDSTYDFIRKIRFNEACRLLTEGKYSVAEISAMVGFTTPSYFSTSFKKYFGCMPSEYLRSKQK